MRAAEQAHPSPQSRSELNEALRLLAAAVALTGILLVIWRPTVIHAQSGASSAMQDSTARIVPQKAAPQKVAPPRDTTTTTHVVKAGETLWSLATRYYGDGHQWKALASRNGIPLTAETSVSVGRKLIVPSRRAVAARPAAPDSTVPAVATTPAAPAAATPLAPGTAALTVTPKRSGALAGQTAGKGDASAGASASGANRPATVAATPLATANPAAAADTSSLSDRGLMRPQIKAERMLTRGPQRLGLVEPGAAQASRPVNEVATIFVRVAPTPDEAHAATRAIIGKTVIAPRHGEYNAAPFAVSQEQLTRAGRVGQRLGSDRDVAGISARPQLADEVFVDAPAGRTLAIGDRLLAVRDAGVTLSGARVVSPTGVLQVTRAESGATVRAYVRSMSDVIDGGQWLLPLEGQAADASIHAQPVSGADLRTTVSWASAELQPTLQSFVMLAAGSAEGVKAGDEFALRRARPTGGEEHVATVRVVRSGPLGSTAIVTRQSLPAIGQGLMANRVARVP